MEYIVQFIFGLYILNVVKFKKFVVIYIYVFVYILFFFVIIIWELFLFVFRVFMGLLQFIFNVFNWFGEIELQKICYEFIIDL